MTLQVGAWICQQQALATHPRRVGHPSVALYTYEVRSAARVILPAPLGSDILTVS